MRMNEEMERKKGVNSFIWMHGAIAEIENLTK